MFKHSPSLFVLAVFALFLGATACLARPADQAEFDRVYKDVANRPKGCQVCHFSPTGRSPRNLYGRAYDKEKEGGVHDAFEKIEQQDSDNDGISNLEEIKTGHFPGNVGDKPTPEELAALRGGGRPQPRPKPSEQGQHAATPDTPKPPAILTPGKPIALKPHKPLSIYDGTLSQSDVGTVIGTWGGGTVEEVDDVLLEDREHSLKMTIRGLYEGGRLDLGRPIDFRGQEASSYLVLALKLPVHKVATVSDQGELYGEEAYSGGGEEEEYYDEEEYSQDEYYSEDEGMSGMSGMGDGGYEEYEGEGGEYAGGGAVIEEGGGGGTAGVEPKDSAIQHLRILLIYEKGMRVIPRYKIREEAYDPQTGWVFQSIPLRDTVDTPQVSGSLRRIALLGDGEGDLHVGQVLVGLDPDPLSAVIQAGDQGIEDEFTVNVNETIDLYLKAKETRYGFIRYAWDFDASDGLQEDYVSWDPTETVPVTKDKAGQYLITVTISDMDEIKEPAKATFTLKVVGGGGGGGRARAARRPAIRDVE